MVRIKTLGNQEQKLGENRLIDRQIPIVLAFEGCTFMTMGKGWMYILKCADGSLYTGSTNNIDLRLLQHEMGEGSNHTKKRLPVTLVYLEEYPHVADAFIREKQVQGWNRRKKMALVTNREASLPGLSLAYRDLKNKARSGLTSRASVSREGKDQ